MNESHIQACLEPPHAHPKPPVSASIRARPEDFRVEEFLGFEPTGTGEHLYLEVRKREANTRWVAEQLARHYHVAQSDVGYAGLKDRHAVTTQWFSVRDPTGGADAGSVAIADIEVLRSSRHPRKLRPGSHAGNRFDLILRDITLDDALEARLALIETQGVPNYFGPQRFGHDAETLRRALAWLSRRRSRVRPFERGLYLSAARGWLFNRVLGLRVLQGSWRKPLDGDVVENCLPTAPLWGRGRSATQGEAAQVESAALVGTEAWRDALEHVGLTQKRRPMVLVPSEYSYERANGDGLWLRFALPVGAYATVVLREIAGVRNRARRKERVEGS